MYVFIMKKQRSNSPEKVLYKSKVSIKVIFKIFVIDVLFSINLAVILLSI